jgi:hypothetical protein
MDEIIQFVLSYLRQGLPEATVLTVIGLGAAVSAIVAVIRRYWTACVGKLAIGLVFVIAILMNVIVFSGAQLLNVRHLPYFVAAVIVVALSAIGTNQVLKITK